MALHSSAARPLIVLVLLVSCFGCGRADADASARRQGGPGMADRVVASGEAFACTPVSLWDGDGPFLCAEGPRIRLSGIAAREMDGSCRDPQPCPAASAEAARDHLARLLGEPAGFSRDGHVILRRAATLSCVSLGNGKGKRTAAWCRSPKAGDLSCRMVESGLALKWDRYWRGHRCR